jgi:hypothetical protein
MAMVTGMDMGTDMGTDMGAGMGTPTLTGIGIIRPIRTIRRIRIIIGTDCHRHGSVAAQACPPRRCSGSFLQQIADDAAGCGREDGHGPSLLFGGCRRPRSTEMLYL